MSLVSLRVLLGSFGVARSLTGRNQLANRDFKPIDYPAPDGILSFDILTSVSRTGTNHAEDQPVHLHIDASKRASHVKTNVEEYAGLLGRVCPAAVYEYVDAEGDTKPDAVGKKLVINSQNCIHCKVRRRPFFRSANLPVHENPLSDPLPPSLTRSSYIATDLLHQGNAQPATSFRTFPRMEPKLTRGFPPNLHRSRHKTLPGWCPKAAEDRPTR